MFCIKCGNKLSEGTLFCAQCGTAVNTTQINDETQEIQHDPVCLACGEKIIPGNKFCVKCGVAVGTTVAATPIPHTLVQNTPPVAEDTPEQIPQNFTYPEEKSNLSLELETNFFEKHYLLLLIISDVIGSAFLSLSMNDGFYATKWLLGLLGINNIILEQVIIFIIMAMVFISVLRNELSKKKKIQIIVLICYPILCILLFCFS